MRMKDSKKSLFVLGIILFISISACKNKPEPNPALASIDLLRGEILLCGNPQFGDVSFALECNYDSREAFDLAISLLHSFEYAEAEKAFVKVIDADPECAMAYWGVAMSIYHELWAPPGPKELEKGSKLLEIANSLPNSERATEYLDAIGVFYKDWETLDHRTRELLYEQKMEQLHLNNKDDVEAAVLYALSLTSSADPNDKTYKNQRKSGAILEDLFLQYPNHPGIAHYIIHTYDYPEIASLGLTTARKYAEIAPSSSHAQHMPSHIFTRLGHWQESIDTNINSASAALCYSESVLADGHWSQEIHAMDYMVYAYLQLGDNEKVNEQNAYMKSIKKSFPSNHFAVAYTANAIPARVALENRRWDEAANLELPVLNDFKWENFPWERSILHYARAYGAIRSGDIAVAEKELAIIEASYEQLIAKSDAESTYKAGQVKIEITIIEAWLALEKGNDEKALDLMRLAADLESKTSKHPVTPGEVLPADELLGDMLLLLNKPEDALIAYEVNLEGHPNRFNGLYGAAMAAKQSGDDEKALMYFNQLLKLTEQVNSDRPELKVAQEFVAPKTI